MSAIKALLDTNVLIDFMVPDRPGSEAAAQIVAAAGSDDLSAIISAGALKDAYYIVRKHYDDDYVRTCLNEFMELAEVAPVDRACCELALHSDEPDFEDGIVRVIAESNDANFIVTRDATAFANSGVKTIEPARLAELFG